ncbi:MAG: hypothetical protein AAGB31_11900 [Bdellovibrio sp.]
MKSIILGLSLFSINVLAQTAGKPFQLDNGKYATECWYAGVNNTQDGVQRYDGYDKGVSTVINQGTTNVEYSQSQSEDSISNSVTKTTTTDLGNGLFKQITESTYTDSFGDQTQTQSSKYESTTKVDGNRSQTQTVKKEGEAERPGVGESIWKKMEDGRIVLQSYLREKRSYTSKGSKTLETVVSNSLCIYTLIK